MIIKKLEDGRYLTNQGSRVETLEFYEEIVRNAEAETEPTEKELIMLQDTKTPLIEQHLQE